jgi:carboxylesterase type B
VEERRRGDGDRRGACLCKTVSLVLNLLSLGLILTLSQIGHHVMAYEPSQAPFKKVILESGSTTARAVFNATHPRHEIQFREFLIAAGMAGVPEDLLVNALRNLPLGDVTSASNRVWKKYEPSVRWPFQPVIDGTTGGTIPDLPLLSWARGSGARVPVVTGFNTNEGAVFVPKGADTNAEFRTFFQGLIPTFSGADFDALEKLYPDPVEFPGSPYASPPPPKGCGRQFRRLDAAYAHYAYICPVLQTAHHTAQAGKPVYVYEYAARAPPFNTANHGDEAPVATHDTDQIGYMPGLVAVSDAMHRYWTSFSTSPDGSPNAHRPDVSWPEFVSPFPAIFEGGLQAAGQRGVGEEKEREKKETKGRAAGAGQILVFGDGNDERMWAGTGLMAARANRGTPARVRSLTDAEIEQCLFWWDRVELSQGLGRRLSGIASSRL